MKNFQLLTNQQKVVMLKELLGDKGIIIFFYPKAKTGLCSLEVQQYQKFLAVFESMGFNVIGVSQDKADYNNEFCGEFALEYPLISDQNQELIKAFNLSSEIIDLGGEQFEKFERSSFVLNNKLEIIKEFRDVEPTKHVREIIEFLETI
ncbi:peroxiredoxin [Mesoplasma syrphidae]|uniref:thioredoxin-dependent peroxiredoxin n=1 Tax=Mesoplasma syrphidae TaxID=225999 RepID=A0A2K9BP06_9MOLU|nr:peroxiredoxin [Mesoplasma syrphidae]AUF83773.1 peroxiredoxin [Mesoplasma syrphidae]